MDGALIRLTLLACPRTITTSAWYADIAFSFAITALFHAALGMKVHATKVPSAVTLLTQLLTGSSALDAWERDLASWSAQT